MKIGLFISMLILSIFSCQTTSQVKQNDFNGLTSKIDSIIRVYSFNGVISVSHDSFDIYNKAVGFSDLKNQTPIDFNDQFVIGSISKQITAVLVLLEYEKGKINLQNTIQAYQIKTDQSWTKDVTIHHLLTHTHGILGLNQALEFKPGTEFHYSQLGYELLSQILESVTGQTFEDLSMELFKKLGMNNTYHPNSNKHKNLVKGYEANENGILEFTSHSLENFVPAGGFISTAKDLKKWNQQLYGGELIQKETLKLMATKFATRNHPIFNNIDYGYGLLFHDGEQTNEIGALGYAPGFVSASYYYPQSKFNLVILENTAKNLDDFKQTFIVHTEIMKLIKKQ